jgi:polar amino acid transport system substrate-binding protein
VKSRILAALAVCAMLVLGIVVIGCGSDNNDSSDSGTSSTASGGGDLTATPGIDVAADTTIAASVPADIKSSGTLTVAADATYPPDEFFGKTDNKTVIGMDADLAKAIAQVMGLQADVQNVPFDSIIPGLAANKYNLGMSSFTDTKEREATVDFVDYAKAGTTFYTKADGGTDVGSLEELCGHSIAVEKGTTQQDEIEGQAKKCEASGGDSIDLQVLPDQNGANLAISSGRAELGAADSPVAAYIVEQSDGQFKLGSAYGEAPYGIAIPKDSGLQQPVLDAVNALIKDGTYGKIFSYWGLDDNTIDTATANGATS